MRRRIFEVLRPGVVAASLWYVPMKSGARRSFCEENRRGELEEQEELGDQGESSSASSSVPASDKVQAKQEPVVTISSEHIRGIKIYGIGIKEDPVPGEKRGRGKQYLTSSYWIYAMGVFIHRSFPILSLMVKYAYERSEENPCYDYRYFINVSNALFLKAEAAGLRTRDGRDFFLMANWLAMAAAEVDGFQYKKYCREERKVHRDMFYKHYLRKEGDPTFVTWIPGEEDDLEFEAMLGKYAIECSRIDLIPSVALERLGVHNELCELKFQDATEWMRQGFLLSTRVSSMKRHYESIHAGDTSEDHLAHLIWGFMAITHVVCVFPEMNDLTDFEAIRATHVKHGLVSGDYNDERESWMAWKFRVSESLSNANP